MESTRCRTQRQHWEQAEVEGQVGQRGSSTRPGYTRDKLDQLAAATHRVVPLDDLATVVCAMPTNVPSDPIVAAIADRLLWSDGRHVSYTALAESLSIDSYCRRHKTVDGCIGALQ